jgi:hypothetical protein
MLFRLVRFTWPRLSINKPTRRLVTPVQTATTSPGPTPNTSPSSDTTRYRGAGTWRPSSFHVNGGYGVPCWSRYAAIGSSVDAQWRDGA